MEKGGKEKVKGIFLEEMGEEGSMEGEEAMGREKGPEGKRGMRGETVGKCYGKWRVTNGRKGD